MREGAGGERERAQHYGKCHQPTSVRTHPHALSPLAHCGGGTLTDRRVPRYGEPCAAGKPQVGLEPTTPTLREWCSTS